MEREIGSIYIMIWIIEKYKIGSRLLYSTNRAYRENENINWKMILTVFISPREPGMAH